MEIIFHENNIRRSPNDHSTKPFEILERRYVFDKYKRKIWINEGWKHYKYYNTLQSALDAIRDIRHSYIDKAYYDYPGFGKGIEAEAKYPRIRPTLTIIRYKINKIIRTQK